MDQGVIEKLKKMCPKRLLNRFLLNEGNEGSVVIFKKKSTNINTAVIW